MKNFINVFTYLIIRLILLSIPIIGLLLLSRSFNDFIKIIISLIVTLGCYLIILIIELFYRINKKQIVWIADLLLIIIVLIGFGFLLT